MEQHRFEIQGPAGRIEVHAYDPGQKKRGIALVAHPHPLFGGTMENKVVQTLAKSFLELGYLSVRFNFRGVGKSEGIHDSGEGETSDALFLLEYLQEREGSLPLVLAGFSFGGYVQAKVAAVKKPERLVLVAPAVKKFEVPAVEPSPLLIHGEEDEVIPLQDLFDWARPQGHAVTVLPGTGHFFHGKLTQIKQIVMNNLKD
ncbi:MAG: alpha/beta hydrolase [Burkholderiales bacterium]|nr:alpha/beta hydrolase [Burkholderiales bacterium]